LNRLSPLVLFAMCVLWAAPSGAVAKELSYSKFTAAVAAGQIESVTIVGSALSGSFAGSGEPFSSYAPSVTPEFLQFLSQNDVTVTAQPSDETQDFLILGILAMTFASVVLLLGIYRRVGRIEQVHRDRERD
jgi:ATP-dependent Zn protease